MQLKSLQIKSTADRIFGVNRSVETDVGLNNNEYITSVKNNKITLDVEFAKLDYYNNLLPITDNELDELARVLFSKNIVELRQGNDIYYGTFIEGIDFRNMYKEGYVSLKFELLYPYVFSIIHTNQKYVTESKEIEINNISNIDDYCYLDVDIVQRGTTPIEIINRTTGEKIKINNVDQNEKIRIDSEYKEIYSLTNADKNMYQNIEYDKHFLRMRYGVNRYLVKGNCVCNFQYRVKKFLR